MRTYSRHPRTNAEGYRFGLMGLRTRIMRDMFRLDRPVTVRSRRNALVVLTDEQASEYNTVQQRHGLRKHRRAHRRNVNVDMNNLTDEQKTVHERRLLVGEVLLRSLSKAKKTLRLETHSRVTVPVLVAPMESFVVET